MSLIARWYAAVLFIAALTGCSPPNVHYGDEARYAPAYGGYVLGPEDGSDDPDAEDALVLRDPLDGKKFRCREQLEPWIERHREAAEDRLHDERWEIASPLIMLPHALAAALAIDVFAMNVSFAELPYHLARSEDPRELYDQAEEQVRRERWGQAADTLERLLVRSPQHRDESRALFYLGIAYAQTGRHDRARRALAAFVERSSARDAGAYRKAERWLRYLGEPPPACRSREPVALTW